MKEKEKDVDLTQRMSTYQMLIKTNSFNYIKIINHFSS